MNRPSDGARAATRLMFEALEGLEDAARAVVANPPCPHCCADPRVCQRAKRNADARRWLAEVLAKLEPSK